MYGSVWDEAKSQTNTIDSLIKQIEYPFCLLGYPTLFPMTFFQGPLGSKNQTALCLILQILASSVLLHRWPSLTNKFFLMEEEDEVAILIVILHMNL